MLNTSRGRVSYNKLNWWYTLKTSWRCLFKTSWRCLFKTSWRCLEDVLKTSSVHLEDVLKTSWRGLEDVLKTSWRRLKDVFWRRKAKRKIFVLIKISWRRLKDVLWRGRQKTSLRRLQDVFTKTDVCLEVTQGGKVFQAKLYKFDKNTCNSDKERKLVVYFWQKKLWRRYVLLSWS